MGLDYYIIDFDSTFVQIEALEELASISLVNNPRKSLILEEIDAITKLGMEGLIPFQESLARRLKVFRPDKDHIRKLISILKHKITPSVLHHKDFFKKNAESLFIISGGFRDYIEPVTADYLPSHHILANTFIYNSKGLVTGYDESNPLSRAGGKAKAVRGLNLTGSVGVLGDGFTDFEIKKNGQAGHFFAFCENVRRQSIITKADRVFDNFHEFISFVE